MKLIISDSVIPLPQGFTIPFELVTGLLTMDVIEPSHTLPIDLPATDLVKNFFGHPHEWQSSADLSTVYDNARLTAGPFTYLGAVEIIDAGPFLYKISFRFASGYLTSVVKGESLREQFTGELVRIPGTVTHTYAITWIPQINIVSISVVVDGFTFTEPVSVGNPLEDALDDLAVQLQLLSAIDSATWDAGTYIMTLESLEGVKPVITAYETVELPDGFGGTYEDDEDMAIANTEQMSLTFTDLDEQYFLPTIYMPHFYDQPIGSTPYQHFVNMYEAGSYVYRKTSDPFDLPTTIVPCLSRKWLLETFLAKYGLSLAGTAMADDAISKAHEFVPRSIDTEMYATDTSGAFELQIPVPDLLPDISLSDWLKSFKIIHCLGFVFYPQNKSLFLYKLSSLLKSTAAGDVTARVINQKPASQQRYEGIRFGYTIPSDDQELKERQKRRETMNIKGSVFNYAALAAKTALSLPDDVYFVQAENAFYRLNVTQDPEVKTWLFHSHNFDDYLDAEETMEYRTVYCPIADVTALGQGQGMMVPKPDVIGYSLPHGLDDKDFSPRFSIYRGLQPGSAATNYPMSSIGTHREDESDIPGATTAAVFSHHPKGLHLVSHAEWFELQKKKKTYPVVFYASQSMLKAIDPSKKYMINGAKFIVDKVSAEITDGEATLATFTLTKVSS